MEMKTTSSIRKQSHSRYIGRRAFYIYKDDANVGGSQEAPDLSFFCFVLRDLDMMIMFLRKPIIMFEVLRHS